MLTRHCSDHNATYANIESLYWTPETKYNVVCLLYLNKNLPSLKIWKNFAHLGSFLGSGSGLVAKLRTTLVTLWTVAP